MTPSHSNIKNILIVGGGVTGWMAAAYLNRMLRAAGCTITLVESVKLETSAIGEATLPTLVRFLRSMNVDESRFMQQCSATYKLATRFVDWIRPGHDFWHPHGLAGGTINDIDVFHFWLKGSRAGADVGSYPSYSLQVLLAERNQAPRPVRGPSPIMEMAGYGYHLDPATLADFFRELAVAEDVIHLFDDVRKVAVGEAGQILHVETKSGRTLSADLFLDCTANAELMEQGLGDPWVDWSEHLLCDRAVLLPLPRDPQLPPYTRVTALSAGWMWQIPLSDRVACGYRYSGAHLADEVAARELVGHARERKAASAEPRFQKLRQGRRQSCWRKNCIALGPAAVSIEPLEATDAFLAQKALELLVMYFPDKTICEILPRSYNQRISALYEKVRDFVLLHYLLNERMEGPFWRASKNVAVPDGLHGVMELHAENGMVEPGAVFPETSYHHLFAAADRLPRRILASVEAADFAKVLDIMQAMRTQNADWLARLPSHRDLMDALHRPLV
jgi:tryptophan halogenase